MNNFNYGYGPNGPNNGDCHFNYGYGPNDPYNGGCHIPDMGNTPLSLPGFHGYPRTEPTPRYIAPLDLDVTVNTSSYKYNPIDDTMEISKINNKGKVKVRKLTNGFTIKSKTENYDNDGVLVFVSVEYTTRTGSFVTLIPGDDYVNGRFEKYFTGIIKLPGCSKSENNSLIGFQIKLALCHKQNLFPHQGICELGNGMLSIGGNPGYPKELEAFVAKDVLKRKKPVMHTFEDEIKSRWVNTFGKHPILRFIILLYVLSIMMYFVIKSGFRIKESFYIIPSTDPRELTTEKLIAMFSTNDYHRFPVPLLEDGSKILEKEYSEIIDGPFVVKDNTFADEEAKRIDGVKTIFKCVNNSVCAGNCRNIPIIISKNAGITAVKLDSENVVIIDTADIKFDFSEEQIEQIMGDITAMIYQKIEYYPHDINNLFTSIGEYFHENCYRYIDGTYINEKNKNLIASLDAIKVFIEKYIGISCDDYKQEEVYEIFSNTKKNLSDANGIIEKEVAAKLSEMIRNKSVSVLKKERNMRFEDDGITIVFLGNRLYISPKILKKIVTEMKSTGNIRSVITSLKVNGDLNATDGDTHPFEFHNNRGEHERVYMYDVSADILDADILYKLENLNSEAFLLEPGEIPENNFIKILCDCNNCVAGKAVTYSNEENGHCYVTGQSGSGKTYTLSQHIAKCSMLGDKVIIFDNSDSFSYAALCKNLSPDFVNKNITIHDVDKHGIPVDIFKIDRNLSLPSQKKQLMGILLAGIGTLSATQSNTLRTKLSAVLSGNNGKFDFRKIIPILMDEENENSNSTNASLLNRLSPLFEDIEEFRISDMSWAEFIRSSKNIIIIRTESDFSDYKNQIVDMMLVTLYRYQQENPQTPLDIFMDEIQNFDFSKNGPIYKIMKEGRKYHISLIGATQDFYPRNTELGSVMGKAGTLIFHRPTINSQNLVASELRFCKEDMSRFDSMQLGEVIVKGNLYNKEMRNNIPTVLSGRMVSFTCDASI